MKTPAESKGPTGADSPGQSVNQSSYGQILRSSSIIGASQAANLLITLLRTKVIAVILGPSGVGMLAIFQSIATISSMIAGLGISGSGVREIAKYHESGNDYEIAVTLGSLRRVCALSGVVGMTVLAILSPVLSVLSFGTRDEVWHIIALGFVVLTGNLTASQSALLQGTRRLVEIAKSNVLSALISTILSSLFYYFFRGEGIVPGLISAGFVSFFIASFYARKTGITAAYPRWSDTWRYSGELIKLGLAMIFPGIVAALVAYVTRNWIFEDHGLAGVGVYAAAYSLSGLFVNFVLGAMAADYYPRITAAGENLEKLRALINQQTEVGLLIAFPGMIASLYFSPAVLWLFYSSEFSAGSSMLAWFVSGSMIQVLTWPLGFSLLARGSGRVYLACETFIHLFHLAAVGLGLRNLGLDGVAIAYSVTNIAGLAISLIVTTHLIRFSWSPSVKYLLYWMLPAFVLAVYTSVLFQPHMAHTSVFGTIIFAIVTSMCAYSLAVRLERFSFLTSKIKSVSTKISSAIKQLLPISMK